MCQNLRYTRKRRDQWTTMMQADVNLDCEGLLCPLPVLRARKVLMAMAPGQLLCLRATDAMAAIDLPHFCAESGHAFLEARSDGDVTIYLIRRGDQK